LALTLLSTYPSSRGEMPVTPQPAVGATQVFAPGLMRDKVLFVTGGAGGIGQGICRAFAQLGAKIAICGRTEKKLAAFGAELQKLGGDVMWVRADVRNTGDCKAAVDAVGQKWGKIDVLVNNAAGNFMSLAEDMTANAFKTVIDIDLSGTFNMSVASLPWLRKAAATGHGATVVNITATLHYTACPFQSHAASAKAGIDSLTRTLAGEWAEDGIRVVGVAPGPIAGTEGGPTGRVFGSLGGKASIRAACPMGRYGEVEDIANACVFLSSAGGSFVTGETLVVDGLQWQTTGAAPRLMAKKHLRAAMAKQRDSRKKGSGGGPAAKL